MQRPALAFALVLLSACSSNGVEGRAAYCGFTGGAAGVTVTATAETDIKEEKPKAKLTTKTDADGKYQFTGLLPDKEYIIDVGEEGVMAESRPRVRPAAEGTKLVEDVLQICPLPSEPGIWFYTNKDRPKEGRRFPTDAAHQVSAQRNPTPGSRAYMADLSWVERSTVESPDVFTIGDPETPYGEGLLVIRGLSVRIGRLGAVKGDGRVHVGPYGEGSWLFKDAWYFGASDIRPVSSPLPGERFKVVPLQQLEPMPGKWLGKRVAWAYPLQAVPSGVYYLVVLGESDVTLVNVQPLSSVQVPPGYLLRVAGPSVPDEREFNE